MGESTEQEKQQKFDVFTEESKGYDMDCLRRGVWYMDLVKLFFVKTAK